MGRRARAKVTAKAEDYPWFRRPRPRQFGSNVRKFLGNLFRFRQGAKSEQGGRPHGHEGNVICPLAPSRNASPSLVQVVTALEEAEAMLDSLRGEDVVVVMGPTGSGKSLLMNVIQDRKLRSCRHKRSGRRIYEVEKPLEGFEISHGKESKTKRMESFTRDMGDGGKVVYVDTPGFHDTEGTRLDVVTAILLRKVAAAAERLRICVVISCDSLHTYRGGAVREVADLLSNFTSDFAGSRSAMTFVFTHADQLEEIARRRPGARMEPLHEILQEILEGTEDGEDYVEVLRWMVQCTSDKEDEEELKLLGGSHAPLAFVFNPDKPDAHILRKSFEDFDSAGSGCLQDSGVKLPQAMRSWISVEMQRWKERIEAKVAADDVKEVEALLQIAKLLDHHTGLDDVQEALSCAADMISEQVRALTERAVDLQRDDAELGKVKECVRDWEVADGFARLLVELVDEPEQTLRWEQRPQVRLAKMADELKGACEGGSPFDDEMLSQTQTLMVWAQATDESTDVGSTAREAAETAREAVQAYLKRVCMEDGDVLPAEKVKQLGPLEERLPRLQKLLGIDTEGVHQEITRWQAGIRKTLAEVKTSLDSGVVEQQELRHLWSALQAAKTTASASVSDGLWDFADGAEEQFKLCVSEHEKRLSSSIEEEVAKCNFGSEVKEAVMDLKALSCWQAAPGGEVGAFWKAVELLDECVARMHAALEDILKWTPGSGRPPAPPNHDGKLERLALAELLRKAEALTWVDAEVDLLAHKPFVKAEFQELQRAAETHQAKCETVARTLLQEYLLQDDGVPENAHLLHCCCNVWPAIMAPGKRAGGLEEILRSFDSQVRKDRAALEGCAGEEEGNLAVTMVTSEDWPKQAARLTLAKTAKEDLSFFADANDHVKHLLEEMEKETSSFLRKLQTCLEEAAREEGNYDVKKVMLDSLKCRDLTGGYRALCKLVKEQTKEEVDSIKMEGDIATQGQLLKKFHAAKVLDSHLHGYVGDWADILQQSYDSRCLEEDGILRTAIEEMDVQSAERELATLFSSEDKTLHKKGEDAVRQLSKRLERMVRQTKVEDAESVMALVRTLQGISKETLLNQKLLQEGFRAESLLESMTVDGNQWFEKLWEDLERSVQVLDCRAASRAADSLQNYEKSCKEILDKARRDKACSTLQFARETPARVRQFLTTFCDCLGHNGCLGDGHALRALERSSRMLLNVLEYCSLGSLKEDPLGLQQDWPSLYGDVLREVSKQVVELDEKMREAPAAVAVVTYQCLRELECKGWGKYWGQTLLDVEGKLDSAVAKDRSWERLPDSSHAKHFFADFMSLLVHLAEFDPACGPVWNRILRDKEFHSKRKLFEDHLQMAAGALMEALRRKDFEAAGLWIKALYHAKEDGLEVCHSWLATSSSSYDGPSFETLKKPLQCLETMRKDLVAGLIDALASEDATSFRRRLHEVAKCAEHLAIPILLKDDEDSIMGQVERMLESWDLTRARDFLVPLNREAERLRASSREHLDLAAVVSQLPQRLEEDLENCLDAHDYLTCKKLLAAAEELKLDPYCKEGGATLADSLAKRAEARIMEHAAQLVNRAETSWCDRDFVELRDTMSRLDKLRQHLFFFNPKEKVQRVLEDIKEEMNQAKNQAITQRSSTDEAHVAELGSSVLLLGKVWDGFPRLRTFAEEALHSVLTHYEDDPARKGPSTLFKLGTLMGQGKIGRTDDDRRIAKTLLHEFGQFKSVTVAMFNSQTKVTQKELPETLKKVTGYSVTADGQSPLDVDDVALKTLYQRYEREWKKCYHQWRSGQQTEEGLVDKIIKKTRSLQGCRAGAWSAELRKDLPKLLGEIFAYVTMVKSRRSENVGEDHMFRPHPIQVVGILRLLGCDVASDRLENQLLQVRTGEGKSLILGACSVLLGLLGFRVRCVCYSEYLSVRDFQDFRGIFKAFGVLDRVTYSTIKDYSEDTIEAKGDLRGKTADLIGGCKSSESSPELPQELPEEISNAEEILLIDEVDVLFGQNFYGKTHNVIAELPSPAVGQLVREVWAHRHTGLMLADLREMEAYHELLKKAPQFKDLFDRELSKMLADVKKFDTHKYEINAAKTHIGYRVLDTLSWEAVYGYCTAFAYLHEAEKGSIDSDRAWQFVSQLRIPCGQFSYANNVHPACILGVSGTIQVLSSWEWQVMNKFGIQKWTYLPSVYGTDKLKFLNQVIGYPMTLVDDRDDLFCQVTEQAKTKTGQSRAVIIIFEDDDVVKAYMESKYIRELGSVEPLLESQPHRVKSDTIRRAAMAGRVTITSRQFGRGSDFICYDDQVELAGGVHVVQAFLSEEKSEEVQIKGRTARQGKSGTYSMVLVKRDLEEKFNVDPGSVTHLPAEELYKELKKKRSEKHEADAKVLEEDLTRAEERDAVSHEYFDALLDLSRQSECPKLLENLHELVSQDQRGSQQRRRIILLVDATGSMQGVWDETKSCIEEVLKRILLIGGNCFDMQIVAFRDYSDDKLLEISPRTVDAAKLQQFLSQIECTGGGDGEEAVEHAMAYVREVHCEDDPVTKVVLIGDAPPHSEKMGEKLEHHDHSLITDFGLEADALCFLDVRVDCFWKWARLWGDWAAEAFEEIARKTGGIAAKLENDPGLLMDAVCESALVDIGGQDLVLEYRKRYKQ